jgi:hypothetical protein
MIHLCSQRAENFDRRTSKARRSIQKSQRVRGIEPPCAAWEAAVLPLNYTRKKIFDFRFSIADCNRNKLPVQFGCRRRTLQLALARDPSESSAHLIRYFERDFRRDSERYNPRSSTITATKLRRPSSCKRRRSRAFDPSPKTMKSPR